MPSEVESPMCTTERHEVRVEPPATMRDRLGAGMGEVELVAVAVVVALVEAEGEVEVELAVGAAATGRRGAGRCCEVAEDRAGGVGPDRPPRGAGGNRTGGGASA